MQRFERWKNIAILGVICLMSQQLITGIAYGKLEYISTEEMDQIWEDIAQFIDVSGDNQQIAPPTPVDESGPRLVADVGSLFSADVDRYSWRYTRVCVTLDLRILPHYYIHNIIGE